MTVGISSRYDQPTTATPLSITPPERLSILSTTVSDPLPPPPAPGQRVVIQSSFGVAFFNNTGKIAVYPASLALNTTVAFVNATGVEMSINQGIGQTSLLLVYGPNPTPGYSYTIYRISSGEAFLAFRGTLTVNAPAVETSTGNLFQLFLTGPARYVNNSIVGFRIFSRLFGRLENSKSKVGLLFIVGIAPGDVNMDGHVDVSDLASLGSSFGSSVGQPNYNPYADLNGDGMVDIGDLAVIGQNFGSTY